MSSEQGANHRGKKKNNPLQRQQRGRAGPGRLTTAMNAASGNDARGEAAEDTVIANGSPSHHRHSGAVGTGRGGRPTNTGRAGRRYQGGRGGGGRGRQSSFQSSRNSATSSNGGSVARNNNQANANAVGGGDCGERGSLRSRIKNKDASYQPKWDEYENRGDASNGGSNNNNAAAARKLYNVDSNSDHYRRNNSNNNSSRTKTVQYLPHVALADCFHRYSVDDPTIVRGKIRVLPTKNGPAFVTCDRGSLRQDVFIADEKDRNRALDGDFVFVELIPLTDECGGEDHEGGGKGAKKTNKLAVSANNMTITDFMSNLELSAARAGKEGQECEEDDDEVGNMHDHDSDVEMWHDDVAQVSLWDPVLNLRRKTKKKGGDNHELMPGTQRRGKVISILPPKSSPGKQSSELTREDEQQWKQLPKRTIVGTLTRLPSSSMYLLSPSNKSLPQFACPVGTKDIVSGGSEDDHVSNPTSPGGSSSSSNALYRAEYIHGSWQETHKWPPCSNVTRLCGSCNVHDETKALLVENNVDHGEFSPAVLHDVEKSVKSGRFFNGDEMGWKPTEEMCRGRRDYRDHRVFTIDPTTAKDLDDALHITRLPDGRVEIGVHIADVSHFIPPNSAVDEEALRRATTVYLVNGVIPMLPRPLCEIACSLNENVERLAFSCVWTMNMDGTLKDNSGSGDSIWYGRTVIKSCARLDYATAQNIIDNKVANGESHADEVFWPKSRQPTGGHTIDEVAADVRLMHKVAMARRKLRFENGALALNGIKLAFKLDKDGETPQLCAPYPIRDSNRLIEEYMLLANYLVAQRLITHAHGRALLRNHGAPIQKGMQQVVDVSKESYNFDIDTTNSKTLQESLSRLSRECDDELVVQCITESLVTPMRPAEYIAAGELDEVEWQHFALNIPYYTHFTSPIRRYPDVIVHRLLQATLDDTVENFPSAQKEIHEMADHCNDMRMNARKAQDRSDRVFLSLYLNKNPISSVLGVCLSVGEKTFTVFVPSLGISTCVFLQEHEDEFTINAFKDSNDKRRIVIQPKTKVVPGFDPSAVASDDDVSTSIDRGWKSLDIRVFTKLEVACSCKNKAPIDVRVKVVGPWTE